VSQPAQRIAVECPNCGHCFGDWALGAPELACDPQLGDPGWIQAASAATCPACGSTACCSGLAAERESWRSL
jgi:DNA-directed RNA polymerase subunit RPC12/RpoP